MLQKSHPRKYKVHGLQTVPDGFVSWLQIVSKHEWNTLFEEISSLLEQNDVFSAILLFQEYTKYNIRKIWN